MNLANYLLPNPNSLGLQHHRRPFGKDITNICKANEGNKTKKVSMHSEQMGTLPQPNKLPPGKDAINAYHQEIFSYISALGSGRVVGEPVDGQISEKMREILVDWLVDVHQNFKLKEETLFLAYQYLDQYQTCNRIIKEEYQLVGITCLWIAAKYEEIYPPRIKAFAEVTANTYTLSQLKLMETKIITFLQFNLNRVTPLALLSTLELEEFGNSQSKKHLSLARYLLQMSYLNGVIMKKYDMQTVVIAAVKLSEAVFKKQLNIGYFICELSNPSFHACYKELCLLLQGDKNKLRLTALRRKYQKEKYDSVGRITIKSNS